MSMEKLLLISDPSIGYLVLKLEAFLVLEITGVLREHTKRPPRPVWNRSPPCVARLRLRATLECLLAPVYLCSCTSVGPQNIPQYQGAM